jgi:hypothetical protein
MRPRLPVIYLQINCREAGGIYCALGSVCRARNRLPQPSRRVFGFPTQIHSFVCASRTNVVVDRQHEQYSTSLSAGGGGFEGDEMLFCIVGPRFLLRGKAAVAN